MANPFANSVKFLKAVSQFRKISQGREPAGIPAGDDRQGNDEGIRHLSAFRIPAL